MPDDDFYTPTDIDLLRMENELWLSRGVFFRLAWALLRKERVSYRCPRTS